MESINESYEDELQITDQVLERLKNIQKRDKKKRKRKTLVYGVLGILLGIYFLLNGIYFVLFWDVIYRNYVFKPSPTNIYAGLFQIYTGIVVLYVGFRKYMESKY